MLRDDDFILIVDDNPTNLTVLSQALKAEGLRVRAAADGESAIELAQKKLPALILLDIQMPGIDGFETCRRLKADTTTAIVPIIFTTALADTENKVKGLSVGAVDYITKPFEASEVIARVNVHLQLRYLSQELASKNATLQDFNTQLEQQVQLRTAELQQTQVQLVQQEKLSALGELVAGIAHEFNNPIGCIVNNISPAKQYINNLAGAIDRYRQNQLDPADPIAAQLDLDFILEDLPKLLQSIQVSGERIRDISSSLRNFARSDQDERQVINLHEAINGTLLILGHRLKALAGRPEIQIVKQYGEIPPISCYPGQLSQVLMNLLANAIDALEEAHSKGLIQQLKIVLGTAIEADQLVIRIANVGIAIPADIQSRLFEPRFTTKPVGKGTGLGLSISRQIIEERHQGQLGVNPDYTQGAEFIIRLPLAANI